MKKVKHISLLALLLAGFFGWSQSPAKEPVREFVTKLYFHGIPYEEARSYGKAAIPELVAVLKDPGLEKYWPNVVITLGFIGDPSAVKPLLNFVQESKGEISLNRFRAILRVFQALGHIAQSGDNTSLNTLLNYTSAAHWKAKNMQFTYNQYSGEAMGEVLARQAIVGLGISGSAKALEKIAELKASKETRKDWQDNLTEAATMNVKVKTMGARKVFGNKH